MQAAPQQSEQQPQQQRPKRRVIGRPWVKGQSGNPKGRKPYRTDFNALDDPELEAQRIEAWRIVRSRKASAVAKVAALRLIQRLPRPRAAQPALASTLRDMATSRLPAVDREAHKPAEAPGVTTDESAK